MFYLILICFIVLLIVGPSYWVKHTMEKYSEPADRYSFTGEQLARDLLNHAKLPHVGVEVSELGDHYDPLKKIVRLTPDKFNGRSLTAITVAAHEVGHAITRRRLVAPDRHIVFGERAPLSRHHGEGSAGAFDAQHHLRRISIELAVQPLDKVS